MPTTTGNPPPEDPWLGTQTPVAANRGALPIAVARYKPTSPTGSQFQILPSLRCRGVFRSIGADPGRAIFRYVFDGRNDQSPQSVEQAISTAFNSPQTVNVDDQLVVQAILPGNLKKFLFHGRALKFAIKLDQGTEVVEIVCQGIARDLWSTPISGTYLRDSNAVDIGRDTTTDIPCQFNPKGEPNANDRPNWVTGKGPNGQQGDFQYPSFIDPMLVRTPDVRKPWELPWAARYLIYHHVDTTSPIFIPTGDALDSLLVAQVPNGSDYDPSDQTTYTTKPIVVSDKPMTGRDWPTVLNELVKDRGFGMTFDLDTGDDGVSPETTLRLFRLRTGDLKQLYLQAEGSYFDPTISNVGSCEVERDCDEVINQWTVLGALNRYEGAFVFAPGFPMQSSDAASSTAVAAYDRSAAGFAGNNDAYRLLIFDETGDGHYAIGTTTPITTISSLNNVLGAPDQAGNPAYTNRRRRAIGELISRDSNNKPRRYQLAVSTDYTGASPGVWDGSGTWQVVEGGFELLKDRLGIRITTDNPNALKVGRSQATGAPFPEGVIKLVESLANPGTVNKKVFFRLTCVIEGDKALSATAAPTTGSPLTRTITRIIDARDRFKLWTVCPSSPFFDATKANQAGVIVARDDTDGATAEATANRASSEAGILAGQIRVPRLTGYYQLGDRIQQIAGRGIPLRTDGGTSPTGAIYPVVVKVEHVLEPQQETVLTLSDQDGHRHRIEGKIRGGK